MTEQYLLHCDCGNDVPVLPRHAGEKISCTCGNILDIPTLRVVRQLPPAPDEQHLRESAGNWNPWLGAAFAMGFTLVVIGGAVTGWLGYQISQNQIEAPTVEDVYKVPPEIILNIKLDDLKPGELFEYVWIPLRENELPNRRTPAYLLAREKNNKHYFWMIIASSVIVFGLIESVLAVVISKRRR